QGLRLRQIISCHIRRIPSIGAQITIGRRRRPGDCRESACRRGQDNGSIGLRSAWTARTELVFSSREKGEMHVDEFLVIVPGSPLHQNAADGVAIITGML